MLPVGSMFSIELGCVVKGSSVSKKGGSVEAWERSACLIGSEQLAWESFESLF